MKTTKDSVQTKMKIDINMLITVTNFASLKKLSRQHVYRLAENNELTLIW
jgi:hypothetical protein